jgi:hypothetical protein
MKVVPDETFLHRMFGKLSQYVQYNDFDGDAEINEVKSKKLIALIWRRGGRDLFKTIRNCHHNCDTDNRGCDLTSRYCLDNEHCPKELW